MAEVCAESDAAEAAAAPDSWRSNDEAEEWEASSDVEKVCASEALAEPGCDPGREIGASGALAAKGCGKPAGAVPGCAGCAADRAKLCMRAAASEEALAGGPAGAKRMPVVTGADAGNP